MSEPRVLVVDDEKNIRESLVKILQKRGWFVQAAENGLSAQKKLLEESFTLVVADLKMPGMSGQDLLDWCHQEGPDADFLMISAHGEISDAVKAMKAGARDFLAKPFDPEELILRIQNINQTRRVVRIREDRDFIEGWTTTSPSMKLVYQMAEKAAQTESLILITGESGTGKEVLARKIHQWSQRRDGPFIAVNLGGVPENLLESELFGHEKGAFTGADSRKVGLFEMAEQGTLFLDEIGEMSLAMQIKLLRVLQERKIQRLGSVHALPFRGRILAATNRDLPSEVKKGSFREDLYYRIHVVPLHLPPLRERTGDLAIIAEELLRKLSKSMNRPLALTDAAAAKLKTYSFPGNIRELENLLERAAIFCDQGTIHEHDLTLPQTTSSPPIGAPSSLAEIERKTIEAALLRWEGQQTRAAEELGITRRTLFNKIKDFSLESLVEKKRSDE